MDDHVLLILTLIFTGINTLLLLFGHRIWRP